MVRIGVAVFHSPPHPAGVYAQEVTLAGFRLSARFRLPRLRPTPQRLRRIIAAFAEWGYDEVYLDWHDNFPWTIDERFHSPDAYGEQLVAGLVREATGCGIALNFLFPAPDDLDFVARIPPYQRLFRDESRHRVLELSSPSACKFYTDLIDDFADLLPEAATALIDYRPATMQPELLARSVRRFRERGLRVAVFYTGSVERFSRDLSQLLDGFDLVAVPLSEAKALARTFPGRLIPALSIPSSDKGYAAIGGVAADGSMKGQPFLLNHEPAAHGRHPNGAVLHQSIEETLPAFRVAGERLGTSRVGGQPEPLESGSWQEVEALDRRLEMLLEEGWRCVRAAREELYDAPHRETARELLERAASAYRESVVVSVELLPRLTEIVDPLRLEHAIEGIIGALYEEYLALCGRAGLAVTAEAPKGRRFRPAP